MLQWEAARAPVSEGGCGGASIPDAVIISGPACYKPHLTRLYGGFKRTRNLYGRAVYQKDPDQGDAAAFEAYIYWSPADSKWAVGPRLGAGVHEVVAFADADGGQSSGDAVALCQAGGEDNSLCPCFREGRWAANLWGVAGARFQVDHLLVLEALALPHEAADPAGSSGGVMHILTHRFLDYDFPPAATSIDGNPPLLSLQSPGERATWVPASVLSGQTTGPLFGALAGKHEGDWLADVPPERGGIYPILASLREYPGQLERLFAHSPEVDPEGRYRVHLFDVWQGEWRSIIVDDFVPTLPGLDGRLLSWGGGHGRVLWALVLEKALAKLCGGYASLYRSDPGPLLMALTGEGTRVTQWRSDGGWWAQWGFLPPARSVTPASSSAAPYSLPQRVRGATPLRYAVSRIAGSWQQVHELFHTMRELHRSNSLLLAYMEVKPEPITGAQGAGREDPEGSGLVHGHGYSLLDFVEVEEGGVTLLLTQLRNVWGPERRWRGPWSDDSPEWERFAVARRHHLRLEHSAAGRFWMAWDDLCKYFNCLEVCPMPASARKASHVPQRSARPRQQNGRLVGRRDRRPAVQAGQGGSGWWRSCCTLERHEATRH